MSVASKAPRCTATLCQTVFIMIDTEGYARPSLLMTTLAPAVPRLEWLRNWSQTKPVHFPPEILSVFCVECFTHRIL
jgi:hypothetical protein